MCLWTYLFCSRFCCHHWIVYMCAITFVCTACRWCATINLLIIVKQWCDENWFCELLCIFLPLISNWIMKLLLCIILVTKLKNQFGPWGFPDLIYKEIFFSWLTCSLLGQSEANIHHITSSLSSSFTNWSPFNFQQGRDDLWSFDRYIILNKRLFWTTRLHLLAIKKTTLGTGYVDSDQGRHYFLTKYLKTILY